MRHKAHSCYRFFWIVRPLVWLNFRLGSALCGGGLDHYNTGKARSQHQEKTDF